MIKTNPPPRAELTSRIFSAFCSVSYDICWHLDYTLIFYYMHKVLFYISPPPYWWVGGGLVTFRIAQKAKANYFIHTFCSVLGWDVRSVLTIMGRRLGWSNTLGCSTGNVSAALQLRRGHRCIASKPTVCLANVVSNYQIAPDRKLDEVSAYNFRRPSK